MILKDSVNDGESQCPFATKERKKNEKRDLVNDGESQCPFATKERKKNEKSSTSSSPFVMPPHPPGWKSLPIVGHAPMLRKLFGEGGEPAPAMLEAFNMCDGDISSLDIPGMSENGLYFSSNADYARIVSTDTEHWGKITHKDTRGPFYMARQVIGDALFVASDTEPNWGKGKLSLL